MHEGGVRVAFVSSHARDGGSERYLELLVERLGSAWIAGVIALEDGPLVERLRSRGVRCAVVAAGRRAGMVTARRRMRRAIEETGAEVVHANGIKAALVTAFATPGQPLVWVKHDFARDGWLTRLVASRCAMVVGVSDAVLGAVGGGATRVVPNGIDLAAAEGIDRSAARRRAVEAVGGGDDDVEVVTVVGRLDPLKGHLDVLDALRPVRPNRSGLRLLFVGPPDPSHPDHEARLRSAAFGGVTFTGHRDDAMTLMAGSDVVVVASHGSGTGGNTLGNEGFGLVAVEAMAVGTPVVAYEGGAVADVLGGCGRLVPSRDVDGLRTAITDVLDDPPGRRSLVECGRRRAAAFDLEVTADAMRDVYRSVA